MALSSQVNLLDLSLTSDELAQFEYLLLSDDSRLLFFQTDYLTYDVLSSCYNCLHEEVFEKEGAVV